MAFHKVAIANCRSASIRETPWIPWCDQNVVGIRDGPNANDPTKKPSIIEVDTDNICYDWTGRKFYKTKHPDGWIYEGCIDLGDGT